MDVHEDEWEEFEGMCPTEIRYRKSIHVSTVKDHWRILYKLVVFPQTNSLLKSDWRWQVLNAARNVLEHGTSRTVEGAKSLATSAMRKFMAE